MWEWNSLYHEGPTPKSCAKSSRKPRHAAIFSVQKDDIVLLPHSPSIRTQSQIQQLVFSIPEICTNQQDISSRVIQKRPYRGKKSTHYQVKWTDTDRMHYSKSYGATILTGLLRERIHTLFSIQTSQPGQYCTSMEDVMKVMDTLQPPTLIKANFGASGRNAIRWLGILGTRPTALDRKGFASTRWLCRRALARKRNRFFHTAL